MHCLKYVIKRLKYRCSFAVISPLSKIFDKCWSFFFFDMKEDWMHHVSDGIHERGSTMHYRGKQRGEISRERESSSF